MTAADQPAPIDVDSLPPTQYLILDVLAARHRTGEQVWTFPSRFTNQFRILSEAGLVDFDGAGKKTLRAWLTDAGREAVLLDGYTTPNEVRANMDRRPTSPMEATMTNPEFGTTADSAIYRYQVPIDDRWHEFCLSGAILHVASRGPDAVDVWAYNSGGPEIARMLRVFGTGHPLPEGLRYVGTAIAEPFVWHVMEASSAT